MATIGDILVKVQEQTTIIESVKVLVAELKAAAADPLQLQSIVNSIDENNVALSVLLNTEQEVPPPVDPQQ